MAIQNYARPSLLALGAGVFSFAAQAQDAHFPTLSGEGVMELQTEYGVSSDDPDAERNNTFWRTEIAPTLRFTETLSLSGVVVLEPVVDFDPGEDNFFEDEAVFVEEIKLNFAYGPWAVFAGKFNPGFGISWDFGRGIWSEDFPEDYELAEKIGFGGSYSVEGEGIGEHTLTASTFFSDTSFLSESAFTGRGTTSKSDGGVSNTEDFSSYVVSLDGENAFGVENLYYKLGYRYQAAGDADIGADDETGYEATVGHAIPLTDRISADVLAEYVNISHFEGGPDDNRYLTTSLITTLDDTWNITIGYTSRTIDVVAGDDVDDHLLQISGGYDFGNGLTVDVGWRATEESDVDTDIIGGLVRYSFEF